MCQNNLCYSSIEGSEILVSGQDIRPQGGRPKLLKNSSELVYPVAVKRRGTSTIISENSPKIRRFRDYSELDSGASISGQKLWGFSSDILGHDSIRVGGSGRTSAHRGQEVNLHGTCFMEVTETWRGQTLLQHPSDYFLR